MSIFLLFPPGYVISCLTIESLCDETRNFYRDRNQDWDQKYDGTRTGTKARTRNMVGPGLEPRTWTSYDRYLVQDQDRDYEQE